MKIKFILFISILLVFCACKRPTCPKPVETNDSSDGTVPDPEPRVNELGTTDTLIRIAMLNESVGFISGSYSKAYKTIDGGATWQRMPIYNGGALSVLEFTSPTVGYIGSSSGNYYKTIDAGETWTSITPPGAFITYTDSYFIDNNIFYITGNAGALFRTTDGGVTYTQIVTGFSNNLYKVHVLPNGTILVGGSYASILRSTDNGATWASCSNPAGAAYNVADFYFQSNLVGYATSYHGSGTGQALLMKTIDGGVSWTAISNPDGAANSTYQQIEFKDSQTGYILGGDHINQVGKYLTTMDGGATWTVTNAGTMRLTDIDIYNGKAYCVGFGGAFYVIQ